MNEKQIKHFWLYVLKLEQGKYYVGITTQIPEARMKQHANGFAGATWTKKYKPLKIIDSKDLGNVSYKQAQDYENKVLRKYMGEKGTNNVRGGDLSHPDELTKKFGWYWDKEKWQTLVGVLILVSIIIILAFK